MNRRFSQRDFTEEEHRGAVSNLVAYRAGEISEFHALKGFEAVRLASAVRFAERFEDPRFLACDERLTKATQGAPLTLYGREADVEHEA